LKGAPERVLNRCTKILLNGEEVAFTDELRSEVTEANKSFGALGERVLAFARCDLPADKYPRDAY
jgi:magnesium-transporting ATPase (P-type)